MMELKQFELGERRRVTLEVWLSNGQTFTPSDCSWELLVGGAVEDAGDCEVEQTDGRWRLTAEVQPQLRRTYLLQYTFGLGTEIIKRSVGIEVR